MGNLKWLLRPSWRMAGVWVVLMSGALALIREALLTYYAAAGRPIPAAQAWEILGHVSGAAFVLAGLAVVVGEVRSREAMAQVLAVANTAIPNASDPPLAQAALPVAPPRLYVREAPSEIMGRIAAARWNERDAVAQASYLGRWYRGRGRIYRIEQDYPGFSAIVARDAKVDPKELVVLRFADAERSHLELVHEGDHVDYEGQISSVTTLLSLQNVRIAAVEESDAP